jgi:cytochrome P450
VEDLPRLRYADMVVKESMRLYPPAWAFGREALADCEIGGYHVPAGTQLVVSQWVTHRDPRYYEAPGEFRPERWAEGSVEKLPKYAYFPFGGGPRVCIGQSFARMEAVLLLATIAQQFRLHFAPGERVVPQPSITLRPKNGMRMVLERR